MANSPTPSTELPPLGCIRFQTAFDRFCSSKWPSEPPFEMLHSIWELLLKRGPRNSTKRYRAQLAAIQAHRQGYTASDDFEVYIENRLTWAAELEGSEFIAAFRSSHLKAVGSSGVVIEPESWRGARFLLSPAPHFEGEAFSTRVLFVSEADLTDWIKTYQTPERVGYRKMAGSHRQVLALLQTMVLLRGITYPRAEVLALSWGFRRFRDSGETIEADDQDASAAAASKRPGPKGRGERLQTKDAEKACVAWLTTEYMAKSPLVRTHTKRELWPTVQRKWPAIGWDRFRRQLWRSAAGETPAWSAPGKSHG